MTRWFARLAWLFALICVSQSALATPLAPVSAIGFENDYQGCGSGPVNQDVLTEVLAADQIFAPRVEPCVPVDYFATGSSAGYLDALSLRFDLSGVLGSIANPQLTLRMYVKKGSYADQSWHALRLYPGALNPQDQDCDAQACWGTSDQFPGDPQWEGWVVRDVPTAWVTGSTVDLTVRLWNAKVDAVVLDVSDAVYAQEFETAGALQEWSGAGTVGTQTGSFFGGLPGFGSGFLRNQTVPPVPSILHLENLPPHTHLDLNFLLGIIGTWDGVGGTEWASPDSFNVTVDGAPVFAHVFGTGTGSTNYVPPPGGLMGASGYDRAYDMYVEPAFHDIPHTASTLHVLWFAGGPGWEGGGNESWAIDHLQVVLRSTAPLIAALAPTEGVPGDTVRVWGTGFGSPATVMFNGVPTMVVTLTSTQISCIVPNGATTGPVSVTTTVGVATSATPFIVHAVPQILNITPATGKPSTLVTILGSGLAEVNRVTFGNGGTAAFEIVSDSEIRATVDPDATTGPIAVETPFSRVVSLSLFTVIPLDPKPAIRAVYDIPNDQGGRVFITWDRSDFDRPDLRQIVGYRIWRRATQPGTSTPALARRTGANRLAPARGETAPIAGTSADDYWEAIATRPASFLDGYAFEAATTQDSIAESNPFTAFFVQALTADPYTFYNSAIDSGYSVDNLAPRRPPRLTAEYRVSANLLHWGGNLEHDLREYRLYRGTQLTFVPGPDNLVYAGPDTMLVDTASPSSVYKLSAVDIHGNESRFALATPTGSTTGVAFTVTAHAEPTGVTLDWYVIGLPGVVMQVYRRTEDTSWQAMATVVSDAVGMVRHRDEGVQPGQHLGYRLGMMDGDVDVFSDETWVTVPEARLALLGVAPNPVVSGAGLLVRLSLSQNAPASLQVLDVTGRVVARQGLLSLGVGVHEVRVVWERRPSPGIYWVRLAQGGKSVAMKVGVLG